MRQVISKSSYLDFKGLFLNEGKMFRKRHGAWYLIKVLGCDLILDTWSGAIWIYPEGAQRSRLDADGNVITFHGKRYRIASDFGEFWYSAHMLFWKIHAEKGL